MKLTKVNDNKKYYYDLKLKYCTGEILFYEKDKYSEHRNNCSC